MKTLHIFFLTFAFAGSFLLLGCPNKKQQETKTDKTMVEKSVADQKKLVASFGDGLFSILEDVKKGSINSARYKSRGEYLAITLVTERFYANSSFKSAMHDYKEFPEEFRTAWRRFFECYSTLVADSARMQATKRMDNDALNRNIKELADAIETLQAIFIVAKEQN